MCDIQKDIFVLSMELLEFLDLDFMKFYKLIREHLRVERSETAPLFFRYVTTAPPKSQVLSDSFDGFLEMLLFEFMQAALFAFQL